MLQSLIVGKVMGPFVRHAATLAGGWLVAEGYADESAAQAISGGLVAAGGVVLSLVEKRIRF